VLITLGPPINFIGLAFLKDKQRRFEILFEYALNLTGYIIIFILFSWDKIYYIIKKEGDNIDNYFVFKNRGMYKIQKEKYIEIYKRCSKIKLNKSNNNNDNIAHNQNLNNLQNPMPLNLNNNILNTSQIYSPSATHNSHNNSHNTSYNSHHNSFQNTNTTISNTDKK